MVATGYHDIINTVMQIHQFQNVTHLKIILTIYNIEIEWWALVAGWLPVIFQYKVVCQH